MRAVYPVLRRICSAVTVFAVIGVSAASPAVADPVEDPCTLAFSFFCSFVPIAPHLEHSVDLTQNQPPADPAAPSPDDFVPTSPCASGCV